MASEIKQVTLDLANHLPILQVITPMLIAPILVELGVGITVTFVMIAIYYSFAGRTPRLDDKEW